VGSAHGAKKALIVAVGIIKFSWEKDPEIYFSVAGQIKNEARLGKKIKLLGRGNGHFTGGSNAHHWFDPDGGFNAELSGGSLTDESLSAGMRWIKRFSRSNLIRDKFIGNFLIAEDLLSERHSVEYRAMYKKHGARAIHIADALVLAKMDQSIFSENRQKAIAKYAAMAETNI